MKIFLKVLIFKSYHNEVINESFKFSSLTLILRFFNHFVMQLIKNLRLIKISKIKQQKITIYFKIFSSRSDKY